MTIVTRTIFKSPASVKIVEVDWSAWLGGASIIASGFTVPSGLTKVSETLAGAVAKVKLAGGDLSNVYLVTCQITDSLGRTEERSFNVSVLTT